MAFPDRQSWTTEAPCVRDFVIREYDLSAAGLSVIMEEGLISADKAASIAALPKEERLVRVGLMCRDDDKILEGVEEGTKRAVRLFCRENGISSDDIVSVKRDAVFSTIQASKLKIGEHLKFRLAARYSSFYNLNGVEFYWSSWSNKLTVKGLGSTVEQAHSQYFLAVLENIMRSAEEAPYEGLMGILQRIRGKYVSLDLDEECYREMNRVSRFRMKMILAGHEFYSDIFPGWENMDPIYNYSNFLVPLIAALV